MSKSNSIFYSEALIHYDIHKDSLHLASLQELLAPSPGVPWSDFLMERANLGLKLFKINIQDKDP